MTGKVTNAALDLNSGAAGGANSVVSEPTMEEILASIREIISDDEPNDGLTARERYRHPTDFSNTNAPEPVAARANAVPEVSVQGSRPAQTVAPTAPVMKAGAFPAAASQAAVVDADDDMLEIERLANAIRAREESGTRQQAAPTTPVFQPQQAEHAPAAAFLARPTAQQQFATPNAAQAAPQPQFAPAAPSAMAAQVAAPAAQPETSEIADSVARMMLDEQGVELRAALSELMKPVVRKWLGDNLPTMVERLVRDEIERASRGR